jgi:hypothetical protein
MWVTEAMSWRDVGWSMLLLAALWLHACGRAWRRRCLDTEWQHDHARRELDAAMVELAINGERDRRQRWLIGRAVRFVCRREVWREPGLNAAGLAELLGCEPEEAEEFLRLSREDHE